MPATPERLHAMETGDTSCLHDERQQAVTGRAAVNAFWILIGILAVGGVLYEVLFMGVWPARSLVVVALALLVYGVAYRYWNARM